MSHADIPSLTREQFIKESTELQREFYEVIRGRTLRVSVVLQALMQFYKAAASQLPPEVQAELSIGMAALAGDLLDAPNRAKRPTH